MLTNVKNLVKIKIKLVHFRRTREQEFKCINTKIKNEEINQYKIAKFYIILYSILFSILFYTCKYIIYL